MHITRLKRVICCLSFAILFASHAELQGEDFTPLFNGSDLSGWVRVNTAESTWQVKDEMLICSGRPIGELRTDRMYQNFILELEWRHMKPRGNAGVFVWADDITARGVPFHRGIEVQVLENAYGNTQSHTTHGDIFPIHGATMTPVNGRGGSRAFPTEFRSNASPEWNHYRIECRDGSISLAVNGKVVTQGHDCQPRKGYICLESEGGVVHYRNIRIRELPDTPLDPAQVAIADRGFRCLYLGLNLDGWLASNDAWRANDWVLAYQGDENATLTTQETFGDVDVIVDFRVTPGAQLPSVELRGQSIKLTDAEDKPYAALSRPGQWNRLQAGIHGDQLVVTINETEVSRMQVTVDDEGPLALHATGPVDFANVYVRSGG